MPADVPMANELDEFSMTFLPIANDPSDWVSTDPTPIVVDAFALMVDMPVPPINVFRDAADWYSTEPVLPMVTGYVDDVPVTNTNLSVALPKIPREGTADVVPVGPTTIYCEEDTVVELMIVFMFPDMKRFPLMVVPVVPVYKIEFANTDHTAQFPPVGACGPVDVYALPVIPFGGAARY